MKKILQTILFLFALIHSYSQECKFWPVFNPITRSAPIPFGNSVNFQFSNPNFTIQPYSIISPSNWFTPDPAIMTTAPPNSTPHNVSDFGVFAMFSVTPGEALIISFNSATTTGFYLHIVQTVFRIDFDRPFTVISSDGRINVSGNAIIPTPGPGSSPGANVFFNAGITTLRCQFTIRFFTPTSPMRFAFTFPDNCLPTIFYRDADDDAFGDPNSTISAITSPPGYVIDNTDCNDNDNTLYPGAQEVCDGKDNDCNGQTDESLPQSIYYFDLDGDGYGNSLSSISACAQPPDYFTTISGDCDDRNSSIYPNAPEVCNGYDDNCDGQIDEGLLQPFYSDFEEMGSVIIGF